MRILIIKTAAMGDVVRTGYCLPYLNEKFDDVEIVWLTSSTAVDLLRFNPHAHVLITDPATVSGAFDWIISLEEEEKVSRVMLQEHMAAGRKLSGCWLEGKQWRYSKDSAAWFDMSRISALGLDEANKLKKQNKRGHAAILGEMLGVEILRPSFWGNPMVAGPARSTANAKSPLTIGLNLSAGNRWASKKMPLEEARKLLLLLLQHIDCEILVMGGTADLRYNSTVVAGLDNSRVVMMKLRNVLGFASLIAKMDLVVSTDTLALHLALSQHTPSVAFFSPTSADEIDGWGITEKVTSLSNDYCSYRPDADSSTITGKRVFEATTRLAQRIYGATIQ